MSAGTAVHTITWHLDGPGGHAWPTFACAAPQGADCRLWCAAGCDERCLDPDEHPMKDEGHCLPTTWMEAEGGGAECYNGPPTSPSNGPIEYVWNSLDECYDWHYVTQPDDATLVTT